jgi:hypothetical protein
MDPTLISRRVQQIGEFCDKKESQIDLFPTCINFGKTVAQTWLDNVEYVILLSNNIGTHITKPLFKEIWSTS